MTPVNHDPWVFKSTDKVHRKIRTVVFDSGLYP